MIKFSFKILLYFLIIYSIGSIQILNAENRLRKEMLTYHQLFGILTWTSWFATNLYGEQSIRTMYRRSDEISRFVLLSKQFQENDLLYVQMLREVDKKSIYWYSLIIQEPNNLFYWSLRFQDEWEAKRYPSTHKNLAYTTFVLYSTTALLAFFSPSSLTEDQNQYLGVTPILVHKSMIPLHFLSMLGLYSISRKIEEKGPDYAFRMQKVGWVGFTALSIAFFRITF